MSKSWVTRKSNAIVALVGIEAPWKDVAKQVDDAQAYFIKYKEELEKENASVQDVAKKQALDKEYKEVKTAFNDAKTKGVDYVEAQKKLEETKLLKPAEPASPDSNLQHLTKYLADSFHILQESRLPPIELEKFSGDPLSYFKFVKRFEAVVEANTENSSLRLSRLLQYCDGEAKRVIERCIFISDSTEAYSRAKELLKERFGSETRVVNSWKKRLFSYPAIPDSKKLRDFSDILNGCIETLSSMGNLQEIDTKENHIRILTKLPAPLRRSWQNKLEESDSYSYGEYRIKEIARFIERAANRQNHADYGDEYLFPELRRRDKVFSMTAESATGEKDTESQEVFAAFTNSEKPKVMPKEQKPNTEAFCYYCKENHRLAECKKFQALSPNERLEVVKKERLCFNDLKKGHGSKECKNWGRCQKCKRKHHTLIHEAVESQFANRNQASGASKSDFPAAVSETTPNEPPPSEATCVAVEGGKEETISPVAEVLIINPTTGDSTRTCALLDTGANRTWCTFNLLESIKHQGGQWTSVLADSLECRNNKEVLEVTLLIKNPTDGEEYSLHRVYASNRLPTLKQSIINKKTLDKVKGWNHLSAIPFNAATPSQVQLIIGMDQSALTRPLQVVLGPKAEDPYAIKTALGWVLHGNISVGDDTKDMAVCSFIESQEDSLLSRSVAKFWEYDRCPGDEDDELRMSLEDKKVEDLWRLNITKTNDGHYELPIPYKELEPKLPSNRTAAVQRLSGLKKRMIRNPDFKTRYDTEMRKLFDQNYAEEVSEDSIHPNQDNQGKIWYLPHFEVYDEVKKKSRIVFDAAAKVHNKSINTETLQGPDYTNNLTAVLLRFRQYEVGISGDIESMFYQCRVREEDRDSLRFLYWPEGNLGEEPKTYRMKVHVFGGTWCPSLATFVIRHTARVNQTQVSPAVVDSVSRNFYVDDILQSFETKEEAAEHIAALTKLMKSGGFRLTKWVSNITDVIKSVPESERGKCLHNVDLNTDKLPKDKALGIFWSLSSDTFGVKSSQKASDEDKNHTRREVLSTLASVFDPLGLVAPFILTAKIIFREATRRNKDWDHPLDEDLSLKWKAWLEDLKLIHMFQVPRCVKPQNFGKIAEIQLHIFSDASEMAYASSAYLRIKNNSGEVYISLLTCRSRLAPLKLATIPRLELLGAVTSTQLSKVIRKELDLPINKVTYWTDSQIVLQYLSNSKLRLKTFVANRVTKILEVSSPKEWRYVPTEQNPADLPSRGLKAQDLLRNEMWVKGPEFLQESEENWPMTSILPELQAADEGVKKSATLAAIEEDIVDNDDIEDWLILSETKDQDEHDNINLIYDISLKYSSWRKAVAVVAWLIRSKKLFLKVPGTQRENYLSIEELKEARIAILKSVQRRHFTAENQRNLRDLDPFLDENGLLRVGGRMKFGNFPADKKHQVILPYKDHVTSLIVKHAHFTQLHAGAELTLAETRREFWIVHGKQAVKTELKNCIICKRQNSRPIQQKMGELPTERLEMKKSVFYATGIDCFGPFLIKKGRVEVKRYGCIFVCLTSGAVHIEKLDEMTTSSFLMGFSRFLSRRPTPHTIVSDQGTNFVGGNNEITRLTNEWNQKNIHSFLEKKHIEWKFQPPHASNMSGKIERQIGTARQILEKTFFSMTERMTEEGLSTLFSEIEDILNNRPLTPISDDVNDLDPITPNTLLKGTLETQRLPPGLFVKEDLYLRNKWRQVQFVSDKFWERWSQEYLHSLQTRQKWHATKQNLKPGDILMILDENTPRNQWRLGRVIETHPGRDGLVRKVTLKTKNGELSRPVNKLCLLLEDP